jgi:glycosyltransferase involved in cell wall biosynthesis
MIIQVHNRYRFRSGECIMVEAIINLLRQHGISVFYHTRSSEEVENLPVKKIQSFIRGIYSPDAKKEMTELIKKIKPDIVHVHNLYPLFSPSVLLACQKADVPVVMTCHNYRLTCPIGIHLINGKLCERCNSGQEYWCILKNCRKNIAESISYALRNMVARKLHFFENTVTIFLALSNFQKQQLIFAGFPENRIVVLPNTVAVPPTLDGVKNNDYIAFAGRMSPEKGVQVLLKASQFTPNLPFRITGDISSIYKMEKAVFSNVTYKGWLNSNEMSEFYTNARFMVVPSLWNEPFGLVTVEAMGHGLPVVASRRGGLPEIVEDGVTGFLFEPGNAEDLAEKIKYLWENPKICHEMGQAGREKAIREYSEEVYFNRLMKVYETAIRIIREKR